MANLRRRGRPDGGIVFEASIRGAGTASPRPIPVANPVWGHRGASPLTEGMDGEGLLPQPITVAAGELTREG